MRFAVRIHQSGWTYSQLENVWQESERLGYDGASLYDVLGARGPECWTALTSLTRATHTLAAVPLVLANPYRHPAVLAKMAATLDELSGGRIIVGLGAVVPTTTQRPSGCHGSRPGSGSRRSVRLSR
jgi:alkanesulfonate monooxygenase SsuD/methylene tetrahydromethanopterin reductase-like flavin-dependent oxidoreductase (luciferase family)